jgi:menaquinone-specific isochorismate synthase
MAGPLFDGTAVTARLDGDVDLVAEAGDDGVLLARDGVGLAGSGCAQRIEVAAGDRGAMGAVVADTLAALAGTRELTLPGTGPVAFAALPFDPRLPASFVVPEVVVGRAADGTRWRTSIGSPSTRDSDSEPQRPSSFEVRSIDPPDRWLEAVAAARDELAGGAARKVVLARAVEVIADVPLRQDVLLARLRDTYGSCLLYAVDRFVGASPELLVARAGDVVRAQPMAGTRPRRGDPDADARLAASLLASAKDREEHQITIDAVIDALLDHCSYLDAQPEPSVVAMANVSHLASMVEGRLHLPAPSVLDLVGALHPTPAVCGDPRDVALEMIERYEPRPRGPYAGAVGWVDADGNGEFAVSIRGAVLDGPRAELWAGVGVLADSDPLAELIETEAKLAAMLGAIVRP